jgi:hypothetical protein
MMSFQSEAKPSSVSQYSNFSDMNMGGDLGAANTVYDDNSRISSIDYNQYNPSAAANGSGRGFSLQERKGHGISQSEKKPGPHSRISGQEPQTLSNMMKQDPN